MKLRTMRVKAFGPQTTAALLEVEINTWLVGQGEATFVGIEFHTGALNAESVDDAQFWAFVTWGPA